jgi:hypothetical protein
MTQPNITPQGFRTAAYLETKARMDAARSRSGKTLRKVTCTPPNVKCGGRCIPPNWDCRLKGKGTDPQLRSVKTDPLGGLANIQRGAGRIAKGLVRGNISEVEGGKRAIIRGVVKATPGDLQRKKELTKKLEDQTRVIGIGLIVTTTALGAHSLLMKSNTFGYRDGIGANINDSVRLGISKVLDATPVVKANRARARALAQGGVAAELERQKNPYTAQLTEQLARTKFTATDEDGNSNLSRAVAAIDNDKTFRSATSRFEDWDKAHQSAFWSTKRAGKSVFAEPATNEFLARQFNLKGDDALTSKSIKDAMEFKLKKYKEDLVELAAVQGYKIKTSGTSRSIAPEDRRSFIKGLVKSTLPKGESNDRVRATLTKSLEDTINKAPVTRANDIYRSTLDGFDSFYSSKASAIETAKSEPNISSAMRKSGTAQVLPDARIARAAFVTGKQIKGTAQAELLMREHFFQKVKGSPRTLFPVTDRLATAAASEIEGRSVTPTEAFRILEREGINGAVPTERSSTRAVSRATNTPKGQATRPARRRSNAQRIADLMRQKNKDGTPRYATREAAEAALKRMRKDELQQARIDAYLAVREDLRGKPCGASHIPKAHECKKTASRTSASESKSSKSSSRGKKLALAAGAAAIAGAAVVGGKATFKNRQNIPLYKSTAKHINNGIQKMSSKKVRDTISKLPEKYQGPANKLLGKAKVGLAVVAADAQGFKLTKVDTVNNFSTFKNPRTGHVMSVGAIDDTLVTFVSTPSGKAGSFDKFGIAFQTDLSFNQKVGLSRAQGLGVAKQVKSMFKAQLNEMPENAVLFNNPYKDDGLGNKRNAIYSKFGFKELRGVRGGNMWALKNLGKLTEIPDEQADYVAKLIRGDRADTADPQHTKLKPNATL